MPLRPKALTYQVFLRRFIQFEAGLAPQAPLLLCFLHCNMSSLTVSSRRAALRLSGSSMSCQKSLAEFRVRRRESSIICFLPRHVRGRKHFARSERRIVRCQRTTEAQNAASFLEKSGKATFLTISRRAALRLSGSIHISHSFTPPGISRGGRQWRAFRPPPSLLFRR